jgi:hypothetical protein
VVAGLFGYIDGATISSIIIKDANITVSHTNNSPTKGYFGALAGVVYASTGNVSITDIYVTGGNITNTLNQNKVVYLGGLIGMTYGSLTNSIYLNSVRTSIDIDTSNTSESSYIGGLIGNAYYGKQDINNSSAQGNIVKTGTWVPLSGGFIGMVQSYTGTISSSYSSGNLTVGNSGVTGGFIGKLYNSSTTTIKDNYSVTNIINTGSTQDVGGFIGSIDTGIATITNNYYSGNMTSISIQDDVGGFIGKNTTSASYSNNFWNTTTTGLTKGEDNGDTAGITGITTTQMKTLSTFTDASWSFSDSATSSENIWDIDDTNTTNDGYPFLAWENGSDINVILNQTPTITSNGSGVTATVSIAENTTAVTTVVASDANGDTVTYSISGGADSAKFSIVEATGVLTFISAPDYETPTDSGDTASNNTYVVEVTATDDGAGNLTDTQTITVTVTDIDESSDADNTSSDESDVKTISVTLPGEDGDSNETIAISENEPSEVTTTKTIKEFDDFTTDADGVKVGSYTLEDSNGSTKTQNISSKVSNSTLTNTAEGLKMVSSVVGENGSEVTSTSKVNSNGLIDVSVSNNADSSVSRLLSYKPGGDIDVSQEGDVAVTMDDTNSNSENIELEGKVKVDGSVEHKVSITRANGYVVVSKTISSVKNSKVVITDDKKIQTISVVKNGEDDVDFLSQTDENGQRIHMVTLTDSKTNQTVVIVVKSTIEGAETLMSDDEMKTSVGKEIGQKINKAVAITTPNGETITRFEVLDKDTSEVVSLDPTVEETTPFEADAKILIEEDSNGDIVIRARTVITREIIFK